ncbi:MAG: alpha/beta hydrolase [Hyphomicrobiaceae bacterium]|nr:alpha/beta hydrolase [Hyphomicrobiaceae bacterium]
MAFARIDGGQIEYRLIPGSTDRPPIVLLHEGLGCVALWRDFPDKLARRLGARTLVYSRLGSGRSDPLSAERAPDFMHREALQALPRLLDALSLDEPLLVGHSDGASIAILHAALAGRPVAGLVLMAPHVFVEDLTVASIARIRARYDATDLRKRLARYHSSVDDTFSGWADIWLDPAFRTWDIRGEVARITVPILVIQGEDDEYGTLAQLDAIEAAAKVPVTRLVLARCGHSPHRDHEGAVIDAITAFR